MPTPYATLESIRDAVDNNSGVLTLSMEVVRNAYPADRLGVNVRANISRRLRWLGIAHYPVELPDRHWELVRLYKMGHPIASFIDAVLTPSPDHDVELREAAGQESRATLERVRELVCR